MDFVPSDSKVPSSPNPPAVPVLDYMESARARRQRADAFFMWCVGGIVALAAITLVLLATTIALALILYHRELTQKLFDSGVLLLSMALAPAVAMTILAVLLWRKWPSLRQPAAEDRHADSSTPAQPKVQQSHEPHPRPPRDH
jgi:hypothetical protein